MTALDMGGQISIGTDDRRLRRLMAAGLFGSLPAGVWVQRATTTADVLACYRLRHDVHVEAGYHRRQPGGVRITVHDALPLRIVLAAMAGRKVVGVQVLVVDTPDAALPADARFAAELRYVRRRGRLLAEAAGQAVAVDYRKTAVPTALQQALFAYAVRSRVTDLLTVVGPRHVPFYELLGFRQAGPPREWTTKAGGPVVLVHLDVTAFLAAARGRGPDEPDSRAYILGYFARANPHLEGFRQWR